MKRSRFLLLAFMGMALLAAMTACGGGSSMSSSNNGGTVSSSAVLVNIGDSPADEVMAMAITIGSMSFTDASGKTVTMMSSPTTVEMMHLMGTMQPVAMQKVAQGSYTGMSMTITSALVTYMDPNSHALVQKTVSGPMTATMNFSPAFNVGSSAMVMNMDLDVAHSVSIDGSGNVTMTPAFRTFLNTAMPNASDPEHGKMMHLIGSVSTTSGNNFTMSTLQGMSMNFSIGNQTSFQDMSGMGMMNNGMILMVDGNIAPDGNMMATYVQHVMDSGGMMAMGLVNSVTGSPATQLDIISMDGIGSGMMATLLANGIGVRVDGSTTYAIDAEDADMAGLPFAPVFDSMHVYAGQMISSSGSTGMMGGGMMGGGHTQIASDIELEPQGFSGTVSGYVINGNSATFTLTLTSDSVFAGLTGATTLTVFQQPGTQMRDVASVSNGMSLRVRGLLFVDAGVYKVVAERMTGVN